MFDFLTDEDKPIIVNGAFSNNYIQYESKGDKDKILTVNEYLDMIRLYLVDIINDQKTQSEWKIPLTAAINFISSKPDSNETRIMHAKSNNVESLLQRYQKELEESISEKKRICF